LVQPAWVRNGRLDAAAANKLARADVLFKTLARREAK
jgi:hypothetical protein